MYNILVYPESKDFLQHLVDALEEYGKNTLHVINVVDIYTIRKDDDWFKKQRERGFATIVVSEGEQCMETYDYYMFDRVFYSPIVSHPILDEYDEDLHGYYKKRIWCIGGEGAYLNQLSHICTDFAELPPDHAAATNGLSVLVDVLKRLIGKTVVTSNNK